MQLRTVKKPKSKSFEFGKDSLTDQIQGNKSSVNKNAEIGPDSAESVAVNKF